MKINEHTASRTQLTNRYCHSRTQYYVMSNCIGMLSNLSKENIQNIERKTYADKYW